MSGDTTSIAPQAPGDVVTQALTQLLIPIARLCLGRGITFAAVEEVLKRAFVDAAALSLHQRGSGAPNVSRLSTATGLSRREVTRIGTHRQLPAVVRPSPATQVSTRWMAGPALHDVRGQPMALKRIGKAPSFEALAQSVTRDVHPRSLLDELCRLGLARHDKATDMVNLTQDGNVPRSDEANMLAFLGTNVSDHLAAAVENLQSDERAHMEQAIFADELSPQSVAAARKLVSAQWRALLAAVVPDLQALVDADRAAGHEARERIRTGLYSYHATMADPGSPPSSRDD